MQGRVLDARVLPDLLPGQKVVLLARKEGSAQKPLPFSQRFGQRLASGLGQQRNANDAEESAACEDDVVKEEAFLVVKFHKWSSQHAEPCASQHQTYTSTPKRHTHTHTRARLSLGQEFIHISYKQNIKYEFCSVIFQNFPKR